MSVTVSFPFSSRYVKHVSRQDLNNPPTKKGSNQQRFQEDVGYLRESLLDSYKKEEEKSKGADVRHMWDMKEQRSTMTDTERELEIRKLQEETEAVTLHWGIFHIWSSHRWLTWLGMTLFLVTLDAVLCWALQERCSITRHMRTSSQMGLFHKHYSAQLDSSRLRYQGVVFYHKRVLSQRGRFRHCTAAWIWLTVVLYNTNT